MKEILIGIGIGFVILVIMMAVLMLIENSRERKSWDK